MRERVGTVAKRRKTDYHTGGYLCEFVVESNEIEGEIWKKVPESLTPGNNSYVSNFGRAKSCFGVINDPTPKKNGYVSIQIAGKNFSMHRLVLASFGVVPPSKEHKYGNHRDRNPSNNRLENLEWVTHADNIQHSYDTNSDRKTCAQKLSKPIRGKKMDEELWVEFESANDAARKLGVSQGSISQSCRTGGKVKKVYRFEFSEPKEPPLLPGELWKTLGRAEISNLGRYKDCDGIVKTPTPGADGYTLVGIDRKLHLMHRLVAKLFLPPGRADQTEVDHVNGVEKGNMVSNLRWASRSENLGYSHANPNRKTNATRTSKKIRVRHVCSRVWQVFPSVSEAARVLGLASGNISKACKRNA